MKKKLAGITAAALVISMAISGCGATAPKTTAADSAASTNGAEAGTTGSKTGTTGAEAGAAGEKAADAVTLRLGHVVADESSLDKGLDQFAELVKEKSGGSVVVEVYPNSALGDNTSMAEQLQLGSLDMMAPSVAALSGFTKSTAVFDLPYLFKNEGAAEEVLDGDIGKEIGESLEPSGFHVLSWMTQSWRHVTCNKEVHKPTDMAGMKIRTMDSEYHMAHFNALGASAIPMAFSELYTALQQGTIDAQENPYTNIVNSRFYEVQDYVIETAHIYDACPLIIATSTWDKLTEEQKNAVEAAAKEATTWERAQVMADDEANRKVVEESGTTIVQITEEERKAFREASQSVYDTFEKAQGQEGADMVTAIEAINAKH